jgi:hypothetical protein
MERNIEIDIQHKECKNVEWMELALGYGPVGEFNNYLDIN